MWNIFQIVAQQKVVDESHPDEDKLAEMEGQVEELLKIWEGASENSRELKEGVTKLNKKIKDIQSNKVSKNTQPPIYNIEIVVTYWDGITRKMYTITLQAHLKSMFRRCKLKLPSFNSFAWMVFGSFRIVQLMSKNRKSENRT